MKNQQGIALCSTPMRSEGVMLEFPDFGLNKINRGLSLGERQTSQLVSATILQGQVPLEERYML
jgi:hypothetical protein